jgi:hypothetical protein
LDTVNTINTALGNFGRGTAAENCNGLLLGDKLQLLQDLDLLNLNEKRDALGNASTSESLEIEDAANVQLAESKLDLLGEVKLKLLVIPVVTASLAVVTTVAVVVAVVFIAALAVVFALAIILALVTLFSVRNTIAILITGSWGCRRSGFGEGY